VELDWYIYTDGKDVDLIQAALDDYFLEKLNCKVNLKAVKWADWEDTMPPKVQTGEEIDICSIMGMPYMSYASMGAFYPLDTLWNEYGKNVKGLFSENVWDSLVVNDHIYMVPTLKDNAYIMGYVYNDTLAAELGLDLENAGWSSLIDAEDDLIKALALRNEKHPEYEGMPLMDGNYSDWPWYFAYERLADGSSLAVCNIPGKEASPDKEKDQVYSFGVEGEHWEHDAEGKMQLTNRNADVSNPGWLEWYGIGYGNLTIVDGPEAYVGPDGIMLEKMAEYNNEAILAPHMGFVLDTEPIANEISACANVEREYGYLLQGQTESPEAVNKAVDEFIAKLKENGSDKIVAEVQTQLDEWIANK